MHVKVSTFDGSEFVNCHPVSTETINLPKYKALKLNSVDAQCALNLVSLTENQGEPEYEIHLGEIHGDRADVLIPLGMFSIETTF